MASTIEITNFVSNRLSITLVNPGLIERAVKRKADYPVDQTVIQEWIVQNQLENTLSLSSLEEKLVMYHMWHLQQEDLAVPKPTWKISRVRDHYKQVSKPVQEAFVNPLERSAPASFLDAFVDRENKQENHKKH